MMVLLLRVCIVRLLLFELMLQSQQLTLLAMEQIELLLAVQACRADERRLLWMLATVQCLLLPQRLELVPVLLLDALEVVAAAVTVVRARAAALGVSALREA